MIDNVVLMTPVLADAVLQLCLSRYCMAFAMLYEASVPIDVCTKLAAQTAGNCKIEGMLRGGFDSVQKGQPVSEGFSRNLPAEFLNLWQTGEESGQIDTAVWHLAGLSREKALFVFNELAKWIPRLVYAWIMIIMIILIFRGYGVIATRAGSI